MNKFIKLLFSDEKSADFVEYENREDFPFFASEEEQQDYIFNQMNEDYYKKIEESGFNRHEYEEIENAQFCLISIFFLFALLLFAAYFFVFL